MGYNSGRTGDQTKTLLNKAEFNALYKGTATVDTSASQTIAQGAIVIGAAGANCEVTDHVDSMLAGQQLVISVNGEGLTSLTPFNINNGSGTNAVRQKMPDATINFTGKNPNAIALDGTLDDEPIPTGASGNQSAAFGKDTMALGINSFTNGNKTVTKGDESHAEGYQSVTLGNSSHAEGTQTTAYGEGSHSEGSETVTLGIGSHAEGVRSKTLTISGVTDSGNAAHAEGESTIAAGYGSHTEGLGSYTGPIANAPAYPVTPEPEPSPTPSPTPVTFYGNLAHAEGNYCFAVGTGSHAEGYHTQALHEASHAGGVGTKTYRSGQFVTGWYNATPSSDDLFVIGNGTADNARSNIFVVSLDGTVTAPTFVGNITGNVTGNVTGNITGKANNVTINPDSSYVGALLVNSNNNLNTIVRKDNITTTADGRLTVAHDPTNNMDVATKQYVDSNIPSTYIKTASVSGNTLTLTKQDNSTINFTPSGQGLGIGWGENTDGDLGDYYYLNSPNNDYSAQIGELGFTVEKGPAENPDDMVLKVSQDEFKYRDSYGVGPTCAFIKDPLTNQNGRPLTNFRKTNVTISGYSAVQIRDTSDNILPKSRASDYMMALIGSRYVAEYNLFNPAYSIIIDENGDVYKPQWDSTNGLLLYRVTNPYAKKIYKHHFVVQPGFSGPYDIDVISPIGTAPDNTAELYALINGSLLTKIIDNNGVGHTLMQCSYDGSDISMIYCNNYSITSFICYLGVYAPDVITEYKGTI